jgi:hypothetical protein
MLVELLLQHEAYSFSSQAAAPCKQRGLQHVHLHWR